MRKTEEYIQDRIFWNASKLGIPTQHSSFYQDLGPDIQFYLQKHLRVEAGDPLVFFWKSASSWSLVCCNELLTMNDGEFNCTSLHSITTIAPKDLPHHNDTAQPSSKLEWQALNINTTNGQQIMAPTANGTDTVGLQNILMMLRNLSH